MLALIDADIIAMRMACKHEQHIDWGENEHSSPDDEPAYFKVKDTQAARRECDRFIAAICRAVKTPNYYLCFTGENNFRKTAFPSYKHNRAGKDIPELRQELTDYLKSKHPCLCVYGLEADDLMGIEQTRRNKQNEETIICTVDKDLDQIPGQHYNWNRDELYTVSVGEGRRFFFRQTLSGDPTDGYSGCPGIGKVKAERILCDYTFTSTADLCSAWERVVATYEAAGLTSQDALSNARMAYILQEHNYNHEQEAVWLWSPPKMARPRLLLRPEDTNV